MSDCTSSQTEMALIAERGVIVGAEDKYLTSHSTKEVLK